MAAPLRNVGIGRKFSKALAFSARTYARTSHFKVLQWRSIASTYTSGVFIDRKLLVRHSMRGINQTFRTSNMRYVSGTRSYSQSSSELFGTNDGSLVESSGVVSNVNPFLHESSGQTVLEQISTSPETLKNISELTVLGEPTLTSLGLGGWTPIGLVQHTLELLHTYGELPWVWSIVGVTVIFRAVMFPLIVKAQANTAKLNNIKPELDKVQAQLKELVNSQDTLAKAAASQKLKQLYKDHDCHPIKAKFLGERGNTSFPLQMADSSLQMFTRKFIEFARLQAEAQKHQTNDLPKSLLAPIVQLPLFISFFIGLRRMANLPIESMKVEGIGWLQDLTAYDPYFVLPIVCSFSMLASLELGGEVGVNNPNFQMMKNFFRAMAIIMIPLTAQFPAAIFAYWITSNIFTLGQVSLLKVPAVRRKFGIPEMIVHSTPGQTENFWENFKAGYSNAAATATIKHQEKMKREKRKKVASGPLVETYKYDPTRVSNNQEVFSAARKKNKSKMKNRPGPSM